VAGLKERASAQWQAQRARRPWLDHLVRAWKQLTDTNGSLLAGSLTFFSFLALFPLILLGVSVAGFVLSSDRALERRLLNKIAEQAPGDFGKTVSDAIQSAVDAKTSVGIIALAGVLLTGLGWVNNLRTAVEQTWGHRPPKRNFVLAKFADAVVLAGLGIGLIVSVALTAVGTALSGAVLKAIDLNGGAGATAIATVVGIFAALIADLLIFAFLIIGLPKQDVPRGLAIRAALLAAVGFEILKLAGTYYITRIASNPTYGAFGSIIGVLVWLNLVFRFMLYCAAWTATGVRGRPIVATGDAPLAPPAGSPDRPEPAAAPRRGVAWALVLGAFARRRGR
jgi:membrane protein